MTSLVTHSTLITNRMTMAIGVLNNIKNSSIPVFVKFRHESRLGKNMLPAHTYEIEHDTGILALDMLLAYWDNNPRPTWNADTAISWNHVMVARVAECAIATHGWSQTTSDAITVTWMATVGTDAFLKKHGELPSARMQFYNKGLEDGFFYTCSDWKEFLHDSIQTDASRCQEA